MTQAKTATIKDLMRVEGKAELVDGRIVTLRPHGFLASQAKGAILFGLREHVKLERNGYAIGGTVAFVVDLPHRKSFCPDVAYYVGGPLGMGFPKGAPRFAVEIRGEDDHGPSAEKRILEKRADYFAAGTLVVWDVDILSADVVRAYRSDDPSRAIIFRRGDRAEAEPAVPGWSIAVDDLFPYSPNGDI